MILEGLRKVGDEDNRISPYFSLKTVEGMAGALILHNNSKLKVTRNPVMSESSQRSSGIRAQNEPWEP